MPIEFSDHAKQQLRRRKITQKLVTKVVYNPEEVLTSFRKRRLRRTRIDDKILQVVTITEGSKITVISSYYLKK